MSNRTYEPWQYYASDCLSYFPDVPYQPINGPSYPPAVAACKEQYYAGDVTTRGAQGGRPYQFVSVTCIYMSITEGYIIGVTLSNNVSIIIIMIFCYRESYYLYKIHEDKIANRSIVLVIVTVYTPL